MRTMYRADSLRGEITKIYANRETPKYVMYEFKRERRHSYHCSFFDTWQEAHVWLLAKAMGDVESTRKHLEYRQGEYDKIKGMKEN